MNIEEDINILKQLIREYKRKPETQNEFFIGLIEERALENLLTAYEKEKEKNKELLEQNKDMKSLFNIQASIAKELDFNTNEKMVKFKDEYYVPDTMAINANIGEPKTIELRYISATKYLTKFDEEE